MQRVFAILLALTLLLQTTWAVAATYCEHESTRQASTHYGHHVHVHKSADGKKLPGGQLAQDDDCAYCHAGHPALLPVMAAAVIAAPSVPARFSEPPAHGSATTRTPDRPQWLRLA